MKPTAGRPIPAQRKRLALIGEAERRAGFHVIGLSSSGGIPYDLSITMPHHPPEALASEDVYVGKLEDVTPADRPTGVRRRAEYAGSIQRSRGRQDLCVVWDVSDQGARLVVPSAEKVPDKFILTVRRDGQQRHYCRVMWRTECQIGESFME
jgi:hypothetical protein